MSPSCACATAEPHKALVGRAQWKIIQPPSPEEKMSELGGIIYSLTLGAVGPPRMPFPIRTGKQAWKDHIDTRYRSEEQRGAPFKGVCKIQATSLLDFALLYLFGC